jgi:hypothetical protein
VAVDDLIKGSTPTTKEELEAISGLLTSMRRRSKKVKGSGGDKTTARKNHDDFLARERLAIDPNLESSEEDSEHIAVRELDEGAAKFFAACPLARYRKQKWRGSMFDLVQKVQDTKNAVKTWDLVLMNKAKSWLPGHIRICNPRVPDSVDEESPIELTKRYIRLLRNFVRKHKDGVVAPKQARSARPRKRGRRSREQTLLNSEVGASGATRISGYSFVAVLCQHQGESSSSVSSSDDDLRAQRKLAKRAQFLLKDPTKDGVDAYMDGEIKRLLKGDAMYQRHQPSYVRRVGSGLLENMSWRSLLLFTTQYVTGASRWKP